METRLSITEKTDFEKDGFLIKRNFLSQDEIDLLYGLAPGLRLLV